MSADDGPGRREVAVRVFAAEYEDADLSVSAGEEERSPNYVVTPTGARANRLFVVGVLTETETVGDGVLRARVVDPTGAFVIYAGQYQPEPLAALESLSPPSFVAVTGKARTFQPDDGDRIFTSIRPESVSEVDAETRDRWVVRTAERTVDRVALMASALDRSERGDDLRAALIAAGVPERLAAGTALAIEHYGTTPSYLGAVRDSATDAVRVVTGDRESVPDLDRSPGETGQSPPSTERLAAGGVGEAVPGDVQASAASAGASTAATESETTATADAGERASVDPAADADGATGGSAAESTAEAEATRDADSTDTPDDGAADQAGTPTDAATGDGRAEADQGAAGQTVDEEGLYEMDDDERAEIREEHGVEFNSGEEIPEAGSADIDSDDGGEAESADDGEAAAEQTDPTAAGTDAASDAAGAGESADTGDAAAGDAESAPDRPDEETGEATAAAPDPDELEDVVVEYMRDLDDGSGVDADALSAAIRDDYDVTPGDVEEAIQGALMSGRCYESGDDELTPI
ncbi:MAG: hypothetical protein ABEJ08_04635 [Halobacteriaceae archaeon]